MEKELQKIYCNILQFIDSTRIMASSLSNLANNLSEGIHKIKCKYGQAGKNVKLVELNISTVTAFLNIEALKMI